MKQVYLFLVLGLAILAFTDVNAQSMKSDSEKGKMTQGETISTNSGAGAQTVQVCKPEIKVIQNKCSKCTKCKPKTKYKTVYKTKVVEKEKKVVVYKKGNTFKNRLKLLGGYGPDGVDATVNGSSAIARERKGAIFGIGYERQLTDRWSVGGQYLNNDSYLLDVGYSF